MKGLVAGAAVLAMAPVVTLGLLTGTFAASNSVDGDCTPGPIPTTTSADRGASNDIESGCGQIGDLSPANAFQGPDGYVNDPTSPGRITRRMLHTYNEVNRVFNGWPWGIACWSPHPWNPTSDHPLGRACDFSVGQIGRFPTAAEHTTGWQFAHWAQANATTLGISYIIWDGRIWSPPLAAEGWRRYNGAGIYDPGTPTGGHYDHAHVSVARSH